MTQDSKPERTLTTAELIDRSKALGPREAAELLARQDAKVAAGVLVDILPSEARHILKELGDAERVRILAAAPPEHVRHWEADSQYPENSIGRVMEPPVAVFGPDESVGGVIEKLRDLVKTVFVTYGFVVDGDRKLVGVVTMRDLLFSDREQRLAEVMLTGVFALNVETPLIDAMKQTLDRHYPVYPVCDGDGILVGLVRGQQMFEQQAVELSAQAGSMVGVTKEERLATPWGRSLLFRHPWLQLNLLTAFVAAGVVSVFEGTIEQITVLAVFLPVLAGQSGNTGCQALAVTLRGMTLGELVEGRGRAAIAKEALLGLLNGALVGVTAGIGMYLFAAFGSGDEPSHSPAMLGLVVFLAMIGSCVISGIAGVLVPLILRRVGADPATASSIFLTTATDVVSMGTFLALATWLVLLKLSELASTLLFRQTLHSPMPKKHVLLNELDQSRSLESREYKDQLKKIQLQLLNLQPELRERKRSLIVVVEGPDAAGKGGAIRRITEKLDPRLVRVWSIVKPTPEEYQHHYMWRFWNKLPAYGDIAIFDRSWYGRVLVERAEGFATDEEWQRAYREINEFERQITDDGAILVKLFIHIGKAEQLQRFKAREGDPYKHWKISDEDWRNRKKWDVHIEAAQDMFVKTSTDCAPWKVIAGNFKWHARVKAAKTVLERATEALHS